MLPTQTPGLWRPDSACLGVGNLVWQGRDSWSQRPLSQRPACACSHLPPVPPQEHKAEVKASMTARFPAVGPRGPELEHMGRGMAAQRIDTGTRPPAGQDGTHGARTPPTAGSLSVCPSTCQNPESPWSRWPRARAGLPHRSSGLTTLEVSSGSLKGGRLGSARRWALSPEDGQGPRPLCPFLSHSDPSIKGLGGGWPGDNQGDMGAVHADAVRDPRGSAYGSKGTNTDPGAGGPWPGRTLVSR